MNLSVSAILLYSIVAAAISVYLPFLLVGYARAKMGYDTSPLAASGTATP